MKAGLGSQTRLHLCDGSKARSGICHLENKAILFFACTVRHEKVTKERISLFFKACADSGCTVLSLALLFQLP